MTTSSRRYARFLGLALVITFALCAIGWLPTARLAGAGAIGAMVAGCAVSFASAGLAGGLLVGAGGEPPDARMHRALRAMFVRLAAVIVLGAVAVLSGEFARSPLLFWIGAAYVALLPLEVRLAISD